MVKKLLIGLAVIIVLIIGAGVFFWWYEISPGDFLKSPVEVLDETVYYAQQEDLEMFKRGFTKETRTQMDAMHEYNTNRPPAEFNAEIHWTWEILMARMEREGGFEIVEDASLWDRATEKTVKVKIGFEGREKIYVFQKEMWIWRIDLTESDPGFNEARSCMRDSSYCRGSGSRHQRP